MKNSKLLAKSITLGLILAMPYGVVSADPTYVSVDTKYESGVYEDTAGVQINKDKTLYGDRNSTDMHISGNFKNGDTIWIHGMVKDAKTLTIDGVTRIYDNGSINNIGTVTLKNNAINNGEIKNVNKLNLEGKLDNAGTISVEAIDKSTNIVNKTTGVIKVDGTLKTDLIENTGKVEAGEIYITSLETNGVYNRSGGSIKTGSITGIGVIRNYGTIEVGTINIEKDIINGLSGSSGTIIANEITAATLTNNGIIKANEEAEDNILGKLTVDTFTNNGELTVEDLNITQKIYNTGTLTVDKIGSEEIMPEIYNKTNASLIVTSNASGMISNLGKMSVDGTLTGYGWFAGGEKGNYGSLEADKLIVTNDAWSEIKGIVTVNDMDFYGTMGVLSDGLTVKNTTNINAGANLQFHEESGNSKLNIVNFNGPNTSLQAGGTSMTIETVNVNGNGAIETWYWENEKENATAIKINTVNVNNGSLSITNTTSENASFEATSITLNDGTTLENKDRYATSIGSYTNALDNFTVGTLKGTNANIVNEGKMYIGELNGNDNTIYLNELTEGITAYQHPDNAEASVTIGKNVSTGLTLYGSSKITSTFDAGNLWEGMQQLAHHVINEDTENSNGFTVVAEEDALIGRVTAQADEHSHIYALKEDTNITTAGIGELANVGFMAWRAENDEMHQRMGELRSSTGETGIWARMKRGESESGDFGITNQYNTYQLGYDERVGNSKWYLGGAISCTEGNSSFATGSGENQSIGFTVYGTYVGDDGQYVDLSAKYARLDNEFDVFGRDGIESTGDYRNNGYAFSAEYGKRIEAGSDFWVEPQVQLTYGHLSSANYTTSRGIKVAQDAMDSVVGRVGFAAGKDISAGNVYVKASYLYDFDGETSVTMKNANGASRIYGQDLGGGWFEFGIGTNINLSETSHLYFDVEKAVGGDIDTPWQWNAGVRFDF